MTDGYRIRSPETWARAEADFLAGDTAEQVCARYDLGLSAFHKRKRDGAWRKTDQPDPDPLPDDPEDLPPADLPRLADLALRRMGAAVERGRASEALRWQRFHDALAARLDQTQRAEAEAARRAGFEAERQALRADPPPGLSEYERVFDQLEAIIEEFEPLDPAPVPTAKVQEVQQVTSISDTPAGQAVLTRAERRRRLKAMRKRS